MNLRSFYGRRFITFMKIKIFFIILLVFVSCAPQEVARLPEIRPSEVPIPVQRPRTEVKAPALKFRSFLQCDEKTKDFFNSSGIEMLPFIRVVFFDIDQNGVNEIIAGSKDGSLRLYRNAGSRKEPHWSLDAHYFDGISAGAFSAPAAGDIDGDGQPELLVGTGGFSRDSGRVIFYKNAGTNSQPVWRRMAVPEVDVGNDATPALFDVDHDGDPDLIAGNSEGGLFLFRAKHTPKGIVFSKDVSYFKDVKLGMYVVPAVTSYQNRIVIITGNSSGKLSVLEREYEGRSPVAED